MKIEDLKIGQKVSLYGYIEAIDIENMHDIENTTTLKINTLARTISVNPKWEEVTTELDQPKIVVPQFVAEWYEEHKDKLEEELCYQIWLIRESGAETDFEYWLTETENPIQTLINMHQFGYKEKLYTVEIPNPNAKGHNKIYLCKDGNTGKVYLCKGNFNPKKNKNLRLTEAEIRKDFEWAWEREFAKEVTE